MAKDMKTHTPTGFRCSPAQRLGEQNASPKPSFFELQLERRIERIERIIATIIQELKILKGER